jgi:hypothetical protein
MTTTRPKKYSKEKFLIFLEKYNVSDEIVEKFLELPEEIQRSGSTFKLDVNVTWYDGGNTYYEFELNYYSEELIEYLFSSKVFKNIGISINNLLCELINAKYISKKEKICR